MLVKGIYTWFKHYFAIANNFKMQLPYIPVIMPLGMFLGEILIHVYKETCKNNITAKKKKKKEFFYFLATPMACRRSWARDHTCTTAATMLDPLPTEPLGNSINGMYLLSKQKIYPQRNVIQKNEQIELHVSLWLNLSI